MIPSHNVRKPIAEFKPDNILRMCLSCLKDFKSEFKGNRICAKCKESQKYRNAG